ncbi:MAG: hypothetical protein M3Z33_10475 [Actinomycetota bacterium]|nr:hypothetical protein [Actinomycetota bacterium]
MRTRPARPPLPARAAARLVTGPAAFLAAGVLDWVVLLSRYLRARVRGHGTDWYLE